MHDEKLGAIEIGDEIFGAAPEPFDAAAGEPLRETFRKRKPQVRTPLVDRDKPRSGHRRFEPTADRFDSGSSGTFGHPCLGYAICFQNRYNRS
jgi:hypothetical protein